ncbi:MAG: NEDD8-activating enzyme E1 regulatory subunit [Firmicutes bacterium]|nr:NEDD8-activating enzyme E1 regulatory subunit [Bacillota bacterium]
MTVYEAIQLIKQIGFNVRPVPGTSSYMIETPEGKISWLKEKTMLQLVTSLKDNPNHLRTTLNEIL